MAAYNNYRIMMICPYSEKTKPVPCARAKRRQQASAATSDSDREGRPEEKYHDKNKWDNDPGYGSTYNLINVILI